MSSDTAARLDVAAEEKRKEASRGAAVTALTILTAPLAIFAPLYPPAINLAILPFRGAKLTSDARQAADRLQQDAAQAHLDADCGARLEAAHPDTAEYLKEAVPDQSLNEAIRIQVGDALQGRTDASVIAIEVHGEKGDRQKDSFIAEAVARHLSTVLEIDVNALHVTGAFVGNDAGCVYRLKARGEALWWNVATGLMEDRYDMFHGKEDMPVELPDPTVSRRNFKRAPREVYATHCSGRSMVPESASGARGLPHENPMKAMAAGRTSDGPPREGEKGSLSSSPGSGAHPVSRSWRPRSRSSSALP